MNKKRNKKKKMNKNVVYPGMVDTTIVIGYLAVIIIIISLGGTGMKLTGYATDTAKLNLTISTVVRINFTSDLIDFGNGSVGSSAFNATIDTTGVVIDGTWNATNESFEIENAGNVNASLKLKTGKNAAQFLGGTNPLYQYNVSNIEANSCNTSALFNLGEWYDVNTTNPGTLICNKFYPSNDRDSISIDVKLVIPVESAPGVKTDIFTLTATAVN